MSIPPTSPEPIVPDARPGNWVDRWASPKLRPYLRLARFDRPIGAWLLLFPCWFGLALAGGGGSTLYPSSWYALLFLVGAFVMRGAGCTYNDIVDRDIDGGVARTRNRPIPSGQVTVRQAQIFMIGLCFVGLIVLLQFNTATILLGIASLGLVAVYPFMKRYTYWPQLVLGLTFKWGALVGWTAIRGKVELPALLLYAGCVLWTIGYDTIYAHQDKEDDLAMGLKSTAIRFGEHTKLWLSALYCGAFLLWVLALVAAGAQFGFVRWVPLGAVALLFGWQIVSLDTKDPVNCLARFKNNRNVGMLILLAFLGIDPK